MAKNDRKPAVIQGEQYGEEETVRRREAALNACSRPPHKPP